MKPLSTARPSLLAAAITALAAALLAATVPVAQAQEPAHDAPPAIWFGTPDPDPFYDPLAPRDRSRRPGSALDSRPIDFSPAPEVTMPDVDAWHLRFRTTDDEGSPTVGIATVVAPRTHSVTPAPILAVVVPYNSLGARCTSSRSFSGRNANPLHGAYSAPVESALARGWSVVIPDHYGINGEIGTARGPARLTLDAIRAAQSFGESPRMTAASPVGLDGFSMGGFTTLWASVLADEYAPELDIRAAAVQGSEFDMIAVGHHLDGGPLTSALMSGYIGGARAYPQRFPESDLNELGRRTVAAMVDGCNSSNNDGSSGPDKSMRHYFHSDPFRDANVFTYLESTSLPQRGLDPAFPLYISHGLQDEIVPVDTVQAAYDTWCARGIDVTLDLYPGEHFSTYYATIQSSQQFIDAAFDATPPVVPPTATSCDPT